MRIVAFLIFAILAWTGQAAAQIGQAAAQTGQATSQTGKQRTAGQAAAAPFKPINYGRWVVDGLGDWVEASTDNASGSEFGLLCASDCMIYLDFQVACDEGHDYPAIVNGGAGALPIDMRCYHYGERPIFIAEATGEYIDMLEQGAEIGFAFPLDGGQFRVARFSTRGGYEAMLAAIRIAMKSGTLEQAPKDVSI